MNHQPETITIDLEAGAFSWEIAPGKQVSAMGYNGQIPGPTIRAHVGDTLVVRLKNQLKEATTIHWHGLRVPAKMDGTEEVQAPVQPGETFEYRIELTDPGTFWYHPHTNETVQIERGLYGAIVVEGDQEPTFDADRLWVLDDMKLNRHGEFTEPSWFLPRWLERHNGREGGAILVNGRLSPTVQMAAGQVERWRFVNAANAKYFRLSLGGRPFLIIGADGGLLEQPVPATEALLTPGERIELAVGPFAEGESFMLEALPYERGAGKGKQETIARIEVGEGKPSVATLSFPLRQIEPLVAGEAEPNQTVILHGRRSWKDGVDFTINGHMHFHGQDVPVGELQIWDIQNPSMMDHPFHLHGFFFQVLSINGQPPAYRAWKDTVNVPKGGSVRIAWLPDNRPGLWMYHCHILEHAAAGMMAHFRVVEQQDTFSEPMPVHGCLHEME